MSSATFDAIVIGSSPNELAAAALLGRAGRRVLLLEQGDRLGGPFVTEELAPGFRVDACAHDAGWIPPAIIRDLELERHGLSLLQPDALSMTPLAGAEPLVLWRDQARTIEGLRRRSPVDAERWSSFAAHMAKLAGFLEQLYSAPPPQPVSTRPADLFALLQAGLRLRGLGADAMVEFLRVLPMPVADLLDEWFTDAALKATLAAGGLQHLRQGPRSAGTTFTMLHHQVGRGAGCFRQRTAARGGMGALVEALAAAARARSVTLRTGAEVERIAVQHGRATGVVLASGEVLPCRTVLSGADPRRTFLDLVDAAQLDPEFLRAVRHIKYRGVWAKVNLALDELPEFDGGDGEGMYAAALSGVIHIGPTMDYLERAYDGAKHGGVSASPMLEAVIPSIADPSLAPAGKHVMSVAVQYVPYQPEDGAWTTERADALADRVVDLLSEHAPNLKGLIRQRQVLTPADLEARWGLAEGHLYQGELTLDQILFMRPVPGWSRSATPVEGLYLSGAAAHPGGGILGGPGALAARAVLKARS